MALPRVASVTVTLTPGAFSLQVPAGTEFLDFTRDGVVNPTQALIVGLIFDPDLPNETRTFGLARINDSLNGSRDKWRPVGRVHDGTLHWVLFERILA